MDINTSNASTPGQAPVTLQVQGMTCSGCEQRIANLLRRMEGVRDASADHTTGRVEAKVRPGVDPQAMVAKVEAAGYTVASVRPRTEMGGNRE